MAASMGSTASSNQLNQTCIVIDRIAGGKSFFVETNGKNETDVICAVSRGTGKVYLYRQYNDEKTILQLPNTSVICINSYVNAEGSYFLIGQSDGGIIVYKVSEAAGEDKKKKKKKKKSKHKEREIDRVPATSITAKPLEDVDILFADLLGSKVDQKTTSAKAANSTNHGVLPGDGTIPTAGASGTRTQVITNTAESVLVRENNLLDFLVVNDCLVTCAKLETGWTLSVYKMGALPNRHVVDGSGDNTPNSTCDTTLVYRTFFPNSSDASIRPLIGCSVDISNESQEQQSNQKPCLKCVISGSTKTRPDRGATPKKLLVLEDNLYNDLFGVDSNLLDSPVVVLGLPDGRIYQVALKSLKSHPAKVDGHSSGTMTGSDSFGLNGKMLYHLQESVADITTLECKDGDDKSGSQCLVLLDQQGKLVTVSHIVHETSQVHYEEHCIPGPVTSSCATTTHVVYSTRRALFAIAVRSGSESRTEAAGGKQKRVIVTSSIGVGHVCALEVVKSSTHDNNVIHNQLMATLANGKVVLINFPLTTDTPGNQTQPITAAAAGQRMKEVLHAINNVSVRMHQLSSLSTDQDKVLAELSKACHLAGQLLGGHLGSRIFHTEVQCAFQDDGNQCQVNLQCKVTNRSGFLLSHGWSIVLRVMGKLDWPVADDKGDIASQVTRTVQLENFATGKSLTVVVPLDLTQVPLQLPLQVRWLLYFNIDDFVAEKHVKNTVPRTEVELCDSGALLPFACNTVNVVHLLRPIQNNRQMLQPDDHDSHQTACNSGHDWLTQSIEAVTNVPLLTNRRGCKKDGLASDGPASTTVVFKQEVMDTIKAEMTEFKGLSSAEVLVLKWLFRFNPLVQSAVTGNQLETVTPDGKKITFVCVEKGQWLASEGQGSNSGGQWSRNADRGYVELTMVASDFEVICQLQETVHKDKKDLLERCDHHDVTTCMPRTQIQKQLRHLQGLQQRLETLEDGLTSYQGIHGNQTDMMKVGRDVCEMYRQLRNGGWTL